MAWQAVRTRDHPRQNASVNSLAASDDSGNSLSGVVYRLAAFEIGANAINTLQLFAETLISPGLKAKKADSQLSAFFVFSPY